MNNLSAGAVKNLMTQYNIRPSKKWGQNFLIDVRARNRVIEAGDLQSDEAVLEVGPGFGALTLGLAKRARRVIAVEVDARLVSALQEMLEAQGIDNVQLMNAHILSQSVDDLLRGEEVAKVIANIPYSITSPLLEHFLAAKHRVPLIVLMVQKEVADRLVAKPGTKAFGSLSLFVQYHADVEYLGRVPNSSFYPRPEVDSAIVRLTTVPDRLMPREQRVMFRLIRAAFKQRRKTLRNALETLFEDADQAAAMLRRAGIDPTRRGETLSLQEYMQFAQFLLGE